MSDRQRERGPSWPRLRVFEGFAWVGLMAASLAVLLLVKGGDPAAVQLMEPQGRLWWKWLLALYIPVALALGLLVILGTTLLRQRPWGVVALQVVAAAVLFVVVVANRHSLMSIFGAVPTSVLSWWVVGGLLLALISLAMMSAGLFWSRPFWIRGISALALGSTFLGLPGMSRSTGAEDTLASLPSAQSSTGERLLVIGLDGADWDFLDPLMSRGLLPNLQALKESGVWGELKTLRPTRSAPIWTSVVTGVEPWRHGVVNNSVERLSGSYHRLPNSLPLPRGLGVGYLEGLLRRWGRIAPSTVASFDRRVPALWNIASRNHSPLDFINWWASWPVEENRGRIVSDRTHFWRSEAKGYAVDRGFLTYPGSLLLDLTPLILRPDQVTHEDALRFMEVSPEEFEEMKTLPYRHHRLKSEFKYLYSMFVSNVRISLHLMEQSRQEVGRAADQFVLIRVIDQASHQALEYSELVENHLKSSPEEIEKYSRVVTEVYRAADQAVGEMVAAFGEGNVVVLSDHGFKLQRPRSRYATYGHFGASTPDGILIASGPAFRTGPVEGLGIYDMMPLFLSLKGWPVAEDFVAEVPLGVFRPSFFEEHLVETIDSYGSLTVSLPKEGPILADAEMVERLRALGYLD